MREELTRIYRAARRGALPTADATRLGYLLQTIARLIQDSDLERRLEALEAKAAADDQRL